jgi:hypothetical protein
VNYAIAAACAAAGIAILATLYYLIGDGTWR